MLGRATALVMPLVLAGLGAASLGPPTDADSLEYHLGVPLEWLRHGGPYFDPGWFSARLAGIGEAVNMLGLASGTDIAGALFQWAALLVAGVALRSVAQAPRDRALAWLVVVTPPAMSFLVLSQKPFLLPVSALLIAVVILWKRFGDVRATEIVVVFDCVAFAVACKWSFILTAWPVVALACVAASGRGRLAVTIAFGFLAFTAFVVPVMARNLAVFGDPLSPFLERLRAHPDVSVAAFAAYLRQGGEAHTVSGLLATARGIVVPLELGAVTRSLGVGALAWVVLLRRRPVGWMVPVAAAFAATASTAIFGQLVPRFFLDAYFWLGAAAVAAPWSRAKRLLAYALAAQGSVGAVLAIYAMVSLWPGSLTWGLRDQVMTRRANGYAAARWLNDILPPDAIVIGNGWSHALMPRPFASGDPVTYAPRGDDVARVDALVRASGASILVVEGRTQAFQQFAAACGSSFAGPREFIEGTRNPYNEQRYRVQVFRIRPCP